MCERHILYEVIEAGLPVVFWFSLQIIFIIQTQFFSPINIEIYIVCLIIELQVFLGI